MLEVEVIFKNEVVKYVVNTTCEKIAAMTIFRTLTGKQRKNFIDFGDITDVN